MKIPDKRRLARRETAVCNRDRAFVLDLFQPLPPIEQLKDDHSPNNARVCQIDCDQCALD